MFEELKLVTYVWGMLPFLNISSIVIAVVTGATWVVLLANYLTALIDAMKKPDYGEQPVLQDFEWLRIADSPDCKRAENRLKDELERWNREQKEFNKKIAGANHRKEIFSSVMVPFKKICIVACLAAIFIPSQTTISVMYIFPKIVQSPEIKNQFPDLYAAALQKIRDKLTN